MQRLIAAAGCACVTAAFGGVQSGADPRQTNTSSSSQDRVGEDVAEKVPFMTDFERDRARYQHDQMLEHFAWVGVAAEAGK